MRTSRSSTPQPSMRRRPIENPTVPARGIEAVIVNGQVVFREGRVTGARPGRVLRGAGDSQTNGRRGRPSRPVHDPGRASPGRVKKNVVPFPGTDSHQMRPPI